MRFNFCYFGQNEFHQVYKAVKMGLQYTDVRKIKLDLCSKTSFKKKKKGKL